MRRSRNTSKAGAGGDTGATAPAAEGRRLDPGTGLLAKRPPRPLGFGRVTHYSIAHPLGSLGVALLVIAIVLALTAGVVAFVQPDRVVPILLYGVVAPGAGWLSIHVWYRRAFSRHLHLFREGEAGVGTVVEVEVLVAGPPWWRGKGDFGGEHRTFVSPEQGRYRVHYEFATGGRRYRGVDVLDTRFGNRDLCTVPQPRVGDRLTVLWDSRRPDTNVMALGVGGGLADP